jgi:hypothetical protein
MPNESLINSVNLVSLSAANTGLMNNTLFKTGPNVDCYWKMDLGTSMHVKAVLVIGDVLDTGAYYSTLTTWKLTVGDNSDPTLNPVFSNHTTKWSHS